MPGESGESVFDWTCADLERESPLSQLEARGTVRIALKSAGLDPTSVTPAEMQVVLRRVLPGELTSRAVADAEALCTGMAERLGAQRFEADGSVRPDVVFERLGGGNS